MIDFAQKYETQIQEKMLSISYDDKYKYYWPFAWREKYKVPENTWEGHDFVSVHNGEVIGLLRYSTDRTCMVANNLSAINFSDVNIIFSRDLAKVIDDIFMKFMFRKLRFSVQVGNPIEPSYDRLVRRMGGQIVGTWKQEDVLFDGSITDRKWYEVMRDEYVKTMSSRKRRCIEGQRS